MLRQLWQHKLIKWIVGFLGVVFVGAIGSGVWERVLRPIWDAISRGLLTLLARTFHGYVDTLHRGIGTAQQDTFIAAAAFLIIWMFAYAQMLAPWIVWRSWRRQRQRSRDEEDRAGASPTEKLARLQAELSKLEGRMPRMMKLLFAMSIAGTLLVAAITLRESYQRKACNYVERSIEILAPHVDAQQVLQLRAEYRNVNSAERFYALQAKLEGLAKQTKTEIPTFSAIH